MSKKHWSFSCQEQFQETWNLLKMDVLWESELKTGTTCPSTYVSNQSKHAMQYNKFINLMDEQGKGY